MIRIVTDSAADFEIAEYKERNIACIPLTVMFGDAEYQETVNLDKDGFYRLLHETGEFPKTAQASPGCLMDLIEDAKRCGDDLIYICLSSALSGTCQTAMMTAEDSGYDRVFVVDSRNATGGQRMLVEYAVKLRDEGKTAEEIIAGVASIRDRVVLYACMDTLEYLYRGGRISHTVYAIGSLAQIKPIITVDLKGAVEVPAKAMGMRKGMDYLCKRLEYQKPDPNFPVYAMYAENREVGETLTKKMSAMGIEVRDNLNVGAAIGSHIGPNACGLVYIAEA